MTATGASKAITRGFLRSKRLMLIFPSNTSPAFPAGCFTFRMAPISERRIRGQESLNLYKEAALASIHPFAEKGSSRKLDFR